MKRLMCLIFALLLLSCATAPDPRVLADMPSTAVPRTASFKEGIYSMPGTGVTQIILLFPGGTLLDPKGKEGAAELLCSSMITGGASGISPDDMDKELDSLVVDISVAPQREYTIVSMSFLPDVEDRAVYLMNSIITSPDLNTQVVELNRSLMKQSIIQKNESAVEQAFMTFRKHYYRGDPRQESPTEESVGKITTGDMQKIHRNIFSAKPMMGVIGKLSTKNAALIKDTFKGQFKTSELGYPPSPEYGLFQGQAVQKHCVLTMARQAPDMKDKSYAACVAADLIIGSGGFNSMLVKEVRTKQGLAYSANSFYQAKPLWGVFGIIVVTEPAELENVRQSIKGVLHNISQGISEADVAWAKQTILNRAATEYSTPHEIISHAMDYVFYDIAQDYDGKFLKEVASLDVTAVQQAAIHLSQGQWVEVIINGK